MGERCEEMVTETEGIEVFKNWERDPGERMERQKDGEESRCEIKRFRLNFNGPFALV
jgi:hypothetical protein